MKDLHSGRMSFRVVSVVMLAVMLALLAPVKSACLTTPIQVLKNDEDFISKAYFKRVSTLDFSGVFKTKHIEIEAKSTQNSTIFNFNNIQKHQFERMKHLNDLGALVYLVIEFKSLNKFFLMDVNNVINFYEGASKNVSLDQIKENSIELFLKPNFTLNLIENL